MVPIILTYDPRWTYTPAGRTPFWASLDTVEYVTGLLEEIGFAVQPLQTDETFEPQLREITEKYPDALAFWLNEFMPAPSGRDIFTVSVLEKWGVAHTGPDSRALELGLNKEATKEVFRKLGLPTPASYVVYPGDFSPVYQHRHWDGYVIVKPLLQGNSRGIDETSVIPAGEPEKIREQVEQIHRQFAEAALVERFIGEEDPCEYTVPILIAHDGRTAELPITQIDLAQIPAAQGRFLFLDGAIKDEKYYLKIPADISPETARQVYSDVKRMVRAIGCRDMARIDIRGDASDLYYLEVNVNPGKNRFSYLITAAYALGLEYDQIIAFIPYQAMQRYGLEVPARLRELVEPVMSLFTSAPEESQGGWA
jgi:D-alanine-D-alanine ligase